MNRRTLSAAAFCAAIGISISPALGSFCPILVGIEASDGAGTAGVQFTIPADYLDAPAYQWELETPLSLSCDGRELGSIDSLAVTLMGDPGVNLTFSVTAGPSATDFTITSSAVSFGTLNNPLAYATAGITLTDSNGDGATLTGKYPGGKVYEARYNASNTPWAHLIPTTVCLANSTAVAVDRRPAAGWETINAAVSSIQAEVSFTITGDDMASGSSRFEVAPEPATLSLVLLGAVALLRRRR